MTNEDSTESGATPPGAATDQPAAQAEPGEPSSAAGGDGSSEPAVVELTAEPGIQVPTSALGRAITELQDAQRASHDRLLRLAADYENFKKRSRKEAAEQARRSEEKAVQEFLPIVDNLERALAHADASGGLAEGVGMVHKQFLGALERFGIKPFDAVGQPFDPEHHEAIQQAHSPLAPGIVCLEAQRGYLRGDRLIRPALVVVSLGPAPAAPEPSQGEKEEQAAGADDDAKKLDSGEP